MLIFKDNTGALIAKVHDFGYSTAYKHEDDLVKLPKSEGWQAPEFVDHRIKPAQARKMDVFSFGLVCLWLLFEPYFSGIKSLPSEADWAVPCFNSSLGQVEHVFGRLKSMERRERGLLKDRMQDKGAVEPKHGLLLLAYQFLDAESGWSSEFRKDLNAFFNSLDYDPSRRTGDICKLVRHLDGEW